MKTLNDIVEQSDGKFIAVSFIKKDGTLRTLNGRLGVVKHLRGGECTLDRTKYIIIYDMINKGYRSINRETIQSVTIDGVVHLSNV